MPRATATYEAVAQARRLSLDIPVTIYQAQQNAGLNAALYFIPGEGPSSPPPVLSCQRR
jgi:hypothetical protein